MNHEFYAPTRLFFGAGCLDKLGEVELPGKKAMIITTPDAWIVECGHIDRLKSLLKKGGAEAVHFNKVHPNPGKKQLEEATKLCLEEGCDMLLGFGGGSSIDTAKSVAVLATNGGDLWDYVDTGSGKGKKIENKPLPIIAVTTTSGTGTEADPWIVITKEETNEKLGFGSPSMFPVYAFVDAELMTSVPPSLTAFQGFDALFHAIEGYIANVATPVSDIFALKSISLLGKSLVQAYKNGKDIEARENVAMAATLAGVVESVSDCTGNHAISQAMGAYHDNLPHGAALLSTAKEYYGWFEKVVPDRYADMAKALTGDPQAKAEDLMKKLLEMMAECNVDNVALSEYGMTYDELPVIRDNAVNWQTFLFDNEPVPLTGDEVLEIMQRSYK